MDKYISNQSIEQQLEKYRAWQKAHPEWELYCDIKDPDSLYIQWVELPKKERRLWEKMHKEDAKECFEEFGTKRCKVENMVLSEDLKLYDILDWPPGFCMSVYKTGDKK